MNDTTRPLSEITPSEDPVPLTDKQRDVYRFLKGHVRENGTWPSYQTIASHFGYSSLNSVSQKLKALYARGWIEWRGNGDYYFLSGPCPYCGQDTDHGGPRAREDE